MNRLLAIVAALLFALPALAGAQYTVPKGASPGANSDITSLSGLTTPLSAGQGGTGLTTGGTSFSNALFSTGAGAWEARLPTLSGTVRRTGAVTLGVTAAQIEECDATTASFALALYDPPVGGNFTPCYIFYKSDTTANTVTITRTASDILLPDGTTASSVVLSKAGQYVILMANRAATPRWVQIHGPSLVMAAGGTGADTASGARTNLGAAASGVNTDITSISADTYKTTFSAPGSGTLDTNTLQFLGGSVSLPPIAGANKQIYWLKNNTTSPITLSKDAGDADNLVDIIGTFPLSSISIPASDAVWVQSDGSFWRVFSGLSGVPNGGTGSTSASGARTNLGAAASGVNTDITSIAPDTLKINQTQPGAGTLDSNSIQFLTGSVTLPAVATNDKQVYFIRNRSTGALTVTSAEGGNIIGPGDSLTLISVLTIPAHGQVFLVNVTGQFWIAFTGLEGVATGGTGSTVAGTTTLVGGTQTVANTNVTANTIIQLTGQNSSGTHGELTISARTVGVDFTITSTSALDTRSVGYLFIEP